MQAISGLSRQGYTISVDQDDLVIRHTGQGHPDPATVRPLLEELRQHKQEALEYLQQQTSTSLYQKVCNELAVLWQPGTREYIEQHCPDLAEEIYHAEATANQVWLDCEDGSENLDDFKDALETWRQANLRAIMAHKDERELKGVIFK